MKTRFWIACLIIAGAGACGGGDGGKPSVNATKDNVCSQMAAVACYDLYQCCAETQIEAYLRVTDPRTEAQCVSDVTRLCEQRTGIVDASVTAGRVTFDGAAMNACLKALIVPDASCTTVSAALPWAAACMTSAWAGTVAVGSSCAHTFECANAGTAYCAANQTCTALPTEGMACAAGACATGFFCQGGTTCHAQLAVGATCTANQQCQKGNYCTTGATRVCAALRTAGQSCTGNASCTSNQCLPGTCAGSTQTCFASSDCGGRCGATNNFCNFDRDCGNGTCSIGGATCNGPLQCVGAGNVCVFPVTCNLTACAGDVVCADTQVSADYCTGAPAALPTPP
jgi:hypothetical protein